MSAQPMILVGTTAVPGVVRGPLVVLDDASCESLADGEADRIPRGAIIVARDLEPSRFLRIRPIGGGIALFDGSAHSHVASLARARGVPMIVGMQRSDLSGHAEAILDAGAGTLLASPGVRESGLDRGAQEAAARNCPGPPGRVQHPAITASGERVRLLLNISDFSDLEDVDPEDCDGIGLVRSEMLFGAQRLPDEAAQVEAYRRVVEWARGRPVTIRTLDAGGDKRIDGYSLPAEGNPFLGVRGVRLSLRNPHTFGVQLRALARVASAGPVRAMIPMVTQPWELEATRTLLAAAVADACSAGLPAAMPALGVMIETPASALTIELFRSDFFSIGSNDLLQYVTACARDSRELEELQDPLQPAVLRLIGEVVRHGAGCGVEVSLCGDMAADPACLARVLDAGVRTLSIPPQALARVAAAIAAYGRPGAA